MAFLDALRRLFGDDAGLPGGDRRDHPRGVAEEWGSYSDTSHPEFPDGRAPAADPAEMAAPPETTGYDRDQWRKKLKHILAKLPESEGQWTELMADARALNFEPEWVERCQLEEFTLLVRRVVGDRKVTPREHRALDLARELIGIPPDEAVQTLHSIIAEAEAFFGKNIEGANPGN